MRAQLAAAGAQPIGGLLLLGERRRHECARHLSPNDRDLNRLQDLNGKPSEKQLPRFHASRLQPRGEQITHSLYTIRSW